MNTKHDAIIAVSDEGETFIVKIVTNHEETVDAIYSEEIGLEEHLPAGLYYATISFNNACKCNDVRYCNCGADGCINAEWTDLTPIYQLPEVE